MAVAATVKKDSFGATWSIDADIDLTDATYVGIIVRNEVGTVAEVECAAQSPATGGIIEWTDTTGFWDAAGYWWIESDVEYSGAHRYGDPALIKVEANLNG